MISLLRTFGTFSLVLLLFSCGPRAEQRSRLGTVNLEVTGSAEALPHFERGLLLLHSFEYTDAGEAFAKAAAADPEMPMAFWGLAMCQNFPIWHYENYEEGRAYADSSRMMKSDISELEEDLIRATDILFSRDTEKEERDAAYSAHMKRLYGKYPNSDDVAAFYALSVLGTVKEARDYARYEEAAQIARTVIDRNPQHPGALHYYIHAYDDPHKAHLALDEAYAYAKTAPDAAHALHMPSHIFLPLGLWEELIASNVDAWQASVDRRRRKNLDRSALDYHSLHWLQYGYLQTGKADSAAAIALRMQAYTDSLPARRARNHMVYIQATYCAETDDYTGPIAQIETDLDGLELTSRAQYRHVQGMRAFRQKDAEALREAARTIESECRLESLFLDTADFKICIDMNREMPRQIDIDRSTVMAMQLRAKEALLEGDTALAEKRLREVCEFECSLDLFYGPPQIRKPSPELLGDRLREQGRFAEAAEYYKTALERAPGRYRPAAALRDIDSRIPS